MATGLSLTEEFLVLFNGLKEVAGNSPQRVLTFYKTSKAIRDAVDALQGFLAKTGLEWRLFYGRKVVVPRTAGFEAAWKEYVEKWRFRVGLRDDTGREYIDLSLDADFADPDQIAAHHEEVLKDAFIEQAGAGSVKTGWSDGGAALEAGIECLENPSAIHSLNGWEEERDWENRCSSAVSAYNYLTETIGLDLRDVFRRWHEVPVIFMPTRVSNRYGASDKGSLLHLLDDAIRAYVFGAPAAAITMCRAALETVLKRHYGQGDWERAGLETVVSLASRRHDFIQEDLIKPLVRQSNRILHDYATADRLSVEDDRTILMFLGTVKFLIEKAPSI
jgi:hypothetical protein